MTAPAIPRKGTPLNGKSNGKKSGDVAGPEVAADKLEVADQPVDVSNPFFNMDARPAESFHVCKFFYGCKIRS